MSTESEVVVKDTPVSSEEPVEYEVKPSAPKVEPQPSEKPASKLPPGEWELRVAECVITSLLFTVLTTAVPNYKEGTYELEALDQQEVKSALKARLDLILHDMKSREPGQPPMEPMPEPPEEPDCEEARDRLYAVTIGTMRKYADQEMFVCMMKKGEKEGWSRDVQITAAKTAFAALTKREDYRLDPLKFLPNNKLSVGIKLHPDRFFGTMQSRFDLHPENQNEIVFALTAKETQIRLADALSAFDYLGKYLVVNILTGLPVEFDGILRLLKTIGVNFTQTRDCAVCQEHFNTARFSCKHYRDAVVEETAARMAYTNRVAEIDAREKENAGGKLEFERIERVRLWNQQEDQRKARVSAMLTEEERAKLEENRHAPVPPPIVDGSEESILTKKIPFPTDATMSEKEWDDAEEVRIARIEIAKYGVLRTRAYPSYNEDVKKAEAAAKAESEKHEKDLEELEKLQKVVNSTAKRTHDVVVAFKLTRVVKTEKSLVPQGCSVEFPDMYDFGAEKSPFRAESDCEYVDDKELVFCPNCKMALCCKKCLYGHSEVRPATKELVNLPGHAHSGECKSWKILSRAMNCKKPAAVVRMIVDKQIERVLNEQKEKERQENAKKA